MNKIACIDIELPGLLALRAIYECSNTIACI